MRRGLSAHTKRAIHGTVQHRLTHCGHGVPLDEDCHDCTIGNRASDDAPEHGPCTWNCGSASCTAPEYPRGG